MRVKKWLFVLGLMPLVLCGCRQVCDKQTDGSESAVADSVEKINREVDSLHYDGCYGPLDSWVEDPGGRIYLILEDNASFPGGVDSLRAYYKKISIILNNVLRIVSRDV